MLYLFRKHASSWLIKVALFLIVIVFVFWGGYSYQSRNENQIARVGDQYISINEYNQSYNNIVEGYRRQLKEAFTEDLAQRLNLKQQALDALIERLLIAKASEEMGLKATNAEIQRRVLEIPAFLDNGRFDRNRYIALLQQNRLTPEAFEQQLGRDLSVQKVHEFILRRAVVSEEEIVADFHFNHDLIQVDYVLFDPKSYEDKVTVEEAGLAEFFEKNQDHYKDPERRQIVYVLFRPEAYIEAVNVSGDELREYYEDHSADFNRPQEVKARHILFTVSEGASEEEAAKVRARAQKILGEARKGADFGELARKHSQDTASAPNGGDLGYFSREQMEPAFSDAAFNLKPGQISEPVRTRFGYHVIKVEDVHPERTASFEDALPDIDMEIRKVRAKDVAYEKARDFLDLAYARKDVEKPAESENLTVAGAGSWVTSTELFPGLDLTPIRMRKLFALGQGEISELFETPQGFVVAQVKAIQPPQAVPIDKVRARVEKDYRAEQAGVLARQKASELLAAAGKMGSLSEAAKGMKLTARTSDWFSRKEPDNDLKLLRGEALRKVHRLDENSPFPDAPIELGNRFMVCQLKGKKSPEDKLQAERANIASRLHEEKREMIWQAWMDEQRRRTKVELFREL